MTSGLWFDPSIVVFIQLVSSRCGVESIECFEQWEGPAGSNQRPLVMAGAFMGIGLGGFFDGILFHQLLQIHNMLSAICPPTSVPNIEINRF